MGFVATQEKVDREWSTSSTAEPHHPPPLALFRHVCPLQWTCRHPRPPLAVSVTPGRTRTLARQAEWSLLSRRERLSRQASETARFGRQRERASNVGGRGRDGGRAQQLSIRLWEVGRIGSDGTTQEQQQGFGMSETGEALQWLECVQWCAYLALERKLVFAVKWTSWWFTLRHVKAMSVKGIWALEVPRDCNLRRGTGTGGTGTEGTGTQLAN
jgi:hypothetical protein